jgi:hypothetical protein
MKSPNTKFALGCAAAAVAIPLLLVLAVFVYAATGALIGLNETRIERHMSVWQVIQEWQKESKAEADRDYQERHKTDKERDEDEAREAKLWGNPATAHSLRLEREERRRLEDARVGWGTMIQIFFVGSLMYLVPTGVAILRKHPQRLAISVLNILLGWTFFGWLVALVWAFVKTVPSQHSTAPYPPLRPRGDSEPLTSRP